ncbi:hypothetical protein Trydic_g12342 [Trypoxylus dichotomus]
MVEMVTDEKLHLRKHFENCLVQNFAQSSIYNDFQNSDNSRNQGTRVGDRSCCKEYGGDVLLLGDAAMELYENKEIVDVGDAPSIGIIPTVKKDLHNT